MLSYRLESRLRRFIRICGAAATAFLLAAASSPNSSANQLDAQYGPDDHQKLDVFIPEHAHQAPGVIWIHGGGFELGNRLAFRAVAPFFVARGVVAISIDYRLADGAPQNQWPAQLEDAQLALRWARAHADAFGMDPDHICAMGASAGAQLSLLLAVLPKIEPGDMADQLRDVSAHADCAIAISAPTDFVSWGPHPRIDEKLFGQPTPAKLLSASPALRIKGKIPPVLLVNGTADRTTPLTQAQEMRGALVGSGSPVSLVLHGGGHDMSGMTPKSRSAVLSLAVKFVLNPHDAPPTQDLGAN